MLYISWFSLQLPLCWLSLLPRTIINKSYFTFNCPLKFLLLCPVLVFGLNHIQLFRESESSLKFFFYPGVRFITLLTSKFVYSNDDHHYWERDHGPHMFSPLTLVLFWAEIQNLSLRPGEHRAGGQAGLVWASQPSSVQPPVKTSTQTQSPALAALNPPSLCRVKDGTKMWKFPEKSTHGGLPPSHE